MTFFARLVVAHQSPLVMLGYFWDEGTTPFEGTCPSPKPTFTVFCFTVALCCSSGTEVCSLHVCFRRMAVDTTVVQLYYISFLSSLSSLKLKVCQAISCFFVFFFLLSRFRGEKNIFSNIFSITSTGEFLKVLKI